MPDYRPIRPAASSPGPPPQRAETIPSTEDVSVRPMRLKVLYSFDDENKTNCLARWPQSLDIRTAYLDENTQIGVIELKTCIQAIVAASPELVAKLGQDYTVYAYDYSEYETPLVGQGMLSWVLASSSATPSAPAHQSRTMVTGRVCKNIMGLFSSTSQETLEVKLRLVPVPTSLQSEYIESMKKYRDISQIMPEGFDPQAWTTFIQANPNFFQQISQSRSQSPAVGPGQTGGFGLEHVQRLLSGDRFATKNSEGQRLLSLDNGYSLPEAGVQLPRPSSAASSVHSTTAPKRGRGRPAGQKAAARGRGARAKKNATRPESVDPGYVSNEERFEEGPSKKRAKVTQAEWSGKTDFGKQPESLRVAASTAASVRIHQPTAVRHSNSLANALEGPPREPTPIADPSNRMHRPQLPPPRSSLRRESFATEKKTYASPYVPPGSERPPGSAMTSPEASQMGSSPVDIASSPPVYGGGSTAPSSPRLPTLSQRFDDSGFMSGSIDDLFEDDEMRPIDDEDMEVATRYSKRPDLPLLRQDSEPQVPDTCPPYELPQLIQQDEKAAAQSRQIAKNARLLSRTTSSGDLAPPPIPASDPVRPSGLNRSQTWSGHQALHPVSETTSMPAVTETLERPISRNRKRSESGAGSGARRKQAIQSKLALSVAAGEMPPFCENCGAIETPTWRKAWVKIHSGSPEHVVISEEDGGIIAWQTLQTDSGGRICLYRIIKKSVLKTDEGFTEVLLCNPCGLWLHTRKCMRPKEVWEKPQYGGDGRPKRSNSGKKQQTEAGSEQPASDTLGTANAYTNASSPAYESGQAEHIEANPQLPLMKHRRASSVQLTSPQSKARMNDASALAALERAIKSSPHKFAGSQHSPIEVGDLTPQPTRRILFPSPTLSQQARAKCDSATPSDSQPKSQTLEDTSNGKVDQADKENCPPTTDDDGLDQLFEEDPFISARSITPTPTGSNRTLVFKTPTRTPGRLPPTTGDFFSSAAKALLRHQTTPKRTPTSDTLPLGQLSPFAAHMNRLLSDTNNGSPGSQSFEFLSLPSLHNTPGRQMQMMDFDFSQFDSQDLLSTDVPMPSSPPAWFGVYEDPIEKRTDSLWEDFTLPHSASTPEDDVSNGSKAKTPELELDGNTQPVADIKVTA